MNEFQPGKPGPILFFGSGETLPSSGKAYEHLTKILGQRPNISILETPAGFELNSEKVAGNIRDFLLRRLQNHNPQISIIPARNKSSSLSPDNPEILAPILRSNWLFMGPGSPTYAVRQLEDSLALDYLRAAHLFGASLTLASAAVLAMSAYALPVYEIFKVGDELHWKKGLDYLSMFGLKVVFIPHWNNSDGGKDLDTSRCFMGKTRFHELIKQLPEDITIIGIDEQTALFFDFDIPCACQVFGKGSVTVIRGNEKTIFTTGQNVELTRFAGYHLPIIDKIISSDIKEKLLSISHTDKPQPSEEILGLVRLREKARAIKDWQGSDQMREKLFAKGWAVNDTPNGPQIESLS